VSLAMTFAASGTTAAASSSFLFSRSIRGCTDHHVA
jgi:hypothetical protein